MAGAVGVLATTLALLAAVGVAPVGAQEAARDDVADRLIQSVTGYTTLPEGDTFGESSGPVTVEELAEMVGTDPPEQPGGPALGYGRMFATPAGDGVAMAIGFEGQAADFVAGFRDGLAGEDEVPLFPGEPAPLGDMVAYEVTAPQTGARAALTAFASGSLSVMLAAGDPHDSAAVLRQMVRDQAALTPPTAPVAEVGAAARGRAPSAGTDEEPLAYRLGRGTGLLVVVGVAGWVVTSDTRRRRRAASTTGQEARTDGPRPYPPPPGAGSASQAAPPPPAPPRPPPPPPPRG